MVALAFAFAALALSYYPAAPIDYASRCVFSNDCRLLGDEQAKCVKNSCECSEGFISKRDALGRNFASCEVDYASKCVFSNDCRLLGDEQAKCVKNSCECSEGFISKRDALGRNFASCVEVEAAVAVRGAKVASYVPVDYASKCVFSNDCRLLGDEKAKCVKNSCECSEGFISKRDALGRNFASCEVDYASKCVFSRDCRLLGDEQAKCVKNSCECSEGFVSKRDALGRNFASCKKVE